MRAQSDTQLTTFRGWTLRIHPSAQQGPRLLLLIHGWTGDENSMWVFVRNFPSDYWIVAPRAPFATEPSGYSWREMQGGSRRPPGIEDLRAAAAGLIELADTYAAENGFAVNQFDVIGFSQGGALTNTLALLFPERVGRAAVLAGFVPSGAEALIETHPLTRKPIFVAHGSLDEMVNIDDARRSIQLLERAGAQVTFCEDEVGHRVSAGCLRALQAFFA